VTSCMPASRRLPERPVRRARPRPGSTCSARHDDDERDRTKKSIRRNRDAADRNSGTDQQATRACGERTDRRARRPPSTAASAYRSALLADAPIAYWRLDEACGATAYDSSGNNRNGQYTNVSPGVPGALQQDPDTAIGLGGTTQNYMTVGVPLGPSFSAEIWARSGSATWNTFGWIASARGGNGFIIHPNVNSTSVDFYVLGNTRDSHQMVAHEAPVADITQWHQYALTYDAATRIGTAYLDGRAVGSATLTVARTTGTTVYYGLDDCCSGSRSGYGALDESSLYNTALSAGQILAHYNAATNNPPTVVANVTAGTDVLEGQVATNDGTWTDPDQGDVVTLSASVGAIVKNENGTWSWSYPTANGPSQSRTVTITANDGKGGTAATQFPITVRNVVPAVGVGANAPITQGQTLSRAGTFTDPGADVWSATVDYGTGSGAQSLALSSDKSFSLSHYYPNTGSFTLTVRVNDGDPAGAGIASLAVTVSPLQVVLPQGVPPEVGAVITSSFGSLAGSVPPGDATLTAPLNAAATALTTGDFLAAETALHALNTAMGAATINGTLTIQQMAQLLTYSGTIEGMIGLGPQLPPEVLQQMTQVNTPMFLGAAALIQGLPGGFQSNTGLIQPLLDAGFAITDGDFAAAEAALHRLNTAMGAALIDGTLSTQQMVELLTYSGTIEGVIGRGPQLPPEALIQLTQTNTPAFLGAASLIQSLPGGFQGNAALIQPLLVAGLAITDGDFPSAATALSSLAQETVNRFRAGTLTLDQARSLLANALTISGALGLGLDVDGTAPTTEGAVTGTSGTNGWFKSGDPVRLTLTATADLFAVVSTRYAVNGSAAQAYNRPVTFGNGAYAVTFYSTDAATNAEAAKSVSFKVDQGAPTIGGSGTPANAAGWNNSDVTVSFTCTDEVGGSGVASCGPTPVIVSAEGTTSVTGTATDVAGNSSSANVAVKLDKSAPTVTYSGNAGTYTVDQQITITCAAADALSTVASSTCQTVSVSASSLGAGTYTRSATATDKAGNVGSGSTTFTVVVNPSGLTGLITATVTDSGTATTLTKTIDQIDSAPTLQAASGKVNALQGQIVAAANSGKIDVPVARELLQLSTTITTERYPSGVPSDKTKKDKWTL
jgi:hypothetical protein